MRRPVGALLFATGLAMATVATPSEAQAQWGAGGYGYAPDVYGYALPSYGYGYGNGPAYGTSYYSSYPPYHYGCCRPYYGEAYAVPQATRRGVIHRSRWRRAQ